MKLFILAGATLALYSQSIDLSRQPCQATDRPRVVVSAPVEVVLPPGTTSQRATASLCVEIGASLEIRDGRLEAKTATPKMFSERITITAPVSLKHRLARKPAPDTLVLAFLLAALLTVDAAAPGGSDVEITLPAQIRPGDQVLLVYWSMEP